MDNIKNKQLERIIDTFSKLVNITDEQKHTLLEKYSKMSDIEIIKNLAENVYCLVGPTSPYYDYALNIIRNYNPIICPPINEMKKILDQTYSNQIEGNMSLEENHKLVLSSLTKFCTLFNKYGIDYYIVGALPCFLKINQPLFRYHDDIDIMINEDDIPKISEIIKTTGYKFFDDRFPSKERFIEMQQKKPPHTVLAQNPNNEFHLGFFCFRREADNSITVKEYSHRLEGEKVIVDVLERHSTPLGTALNYDENPIEYNGTKFRTGSLESVYNLKKYTKRPKDITDMKKLEKYIDKQKLEMLLQNPNQNMVIKNVNFSDQLNNYKR